MEIYEPMLAKRGDVTMLERTNVVGYLFEPLFDGIRVLIYKDRGDIAIFNKNKKDIISLYPEMLDLPAYIKTKSCVLDGVLLVLNQNKQPDSKLLQQRELTNNHKKAKLKSKQFPATILIFDILELNGENLTKEILRKRKIILKEIIKDGPNIVLCPYTMHGKDLWKQIEQQEIYGMIAKETASCYLSGDKNWAWLKIINLNHTDVIIAGLIKKEKEIFSKLILSKYDPKISALRYSGVLDKKDIDQKTLNYLNTKIGSLKIMKINSEILHKEDFDSIKINTGEEIVWLRPEIIAKIKFEEKSKNEFLLPSILRLRLDKTTKDCSFD